MIKIKIAVLCLLLSISVSSQEVGQLINVHTVSNKITLDALSPQLGALAFNNENKVLYLYTFDGVSNVWVPLKEIADKKTYIEAGNNYIDVLNTGTNESPNYTIRSYIPTLTDNGDGTYTFNNGKDNPITFTDDTYAPVLISGVSGCNAAFKNTRNDYIFTGENLTSDTNFTISGQTVHSITLISSNTIVADITTGTTAGSFDVKITNLNGMFTLTNGFVVQDNQKIEMNNTTGLTATSGMSVTAAGSITQTSTVNGWAHSVHLNSNPIPLAEKGLLEFSIQQGDVTVGLNADPTTDNAKSSIDYGIIFIKTSSSTGNFEIIENNNNKVTFATYVSGDVFKIEKDCSNHIIYYKNNKPIYYSEIVVTTDLYFDTSFRDTGSSINNVILRH